MISLLAIKFREEVSKVKDIRMKQEAEFPVSYPTGFLSFDFMNGNIIVVQSENINCKYYSIGITDGSLNVIIGRSGCGKTTWSIQTGANIIRKYNTSCMFYDNIEGGSIDSRIERLTKFGPNFKDRVIMRNAGITAENFYERIKMIHDLKIQDKVSYEYDTGLYDYRGNRIYKLEPTVYLLDSLALLMPEKFTDEEEVSGQMSSTAAAKMNSMVFKRVTPMLKIANIILLVINHINEKVEINRFAATKSQVRYLKPGETLPGGRAVIYLANMMVKFDDNDKLKESEAFGINGILVDVTMIKSRSGRADNFVTLVFDQDNGFDEDLSLFIMLKQAGKINGAGVGMYLADRNDMKFSQKNFKERLYKNPELKELFMTEVINHLTQQLEKKVQEELAPINENVTTSILDKLMCVA